MWLQESRWPRCSLEGERRRSSSFQYAAFSSGVRGVGDASRIVAVIDPGIITSGAWATIGGEPPPVVVASSLPSPCIVHL